MKKTITTFLLPVCAITIAAAIALSAADSPRVGRAVLGTAERSLDDKLKTLWDDNPLALVGPTRGIYLEGYGVVFTAEMSPIAGPLALFHGNNYTKEEKDKYHKRRTERVPQLESVMKQLLMASAASLDPVPADEQVVFSILLDHNVWEDVSGTPAQVTVQAQKKKLLEAQRAGSGGSAILEQAVRVSRAN